MKAFFTVLFLSAGLGLFAQPVVLSRNEAIEKNLLLKLNGDYANPEGSQNDTPFSIQKAFQDIYEQMLGKDVLKDLYCWNMLYFNAQGKLDYVMFEVGTGSFRIVNGDNERPRNADSVTAVISAKMAPLLARVVSRRTIGRKAFMATAVSFRPTVPREPQARRDSVVSGMTNAIATRDTLKVKTLSLNQSLLTTVPDVIYRFPNLEQLFLSDNDIEKVNLDLSRLPKLKDLDLSKNVLSENSIAISKNKSLKLLNLQMNLVRNIPPAVRSCKGLESLWMGNNQLTGLSNGSFKRLKSVKDLNFYKADIAVLPKGIRKMRGLEVLDLYYNKLDMLPRSVTRLKKLTHLAVSHNKITALPDRIDRLRKVHTLYAHHNHISKLPDRIVRMQSLRIVDLGYNWLTTFPTQLTAFGELEELDLSANNFTEFPMQLLQIRKLDKLHLRGNPFLGADAERKYSEQLSQLKMKNVEVFY